MVRSDKDVGSVKTIQYNNNELQTMKCKIWNSIIIIIMRIYIYFFRFLQTQFYCNVFQEKEYKMFIFFNKKKICKYIEHRRRNITSYISGSWIMKYNII